MKSHISICVLICTVLRFKVVKPSGVMVLKHSCRKFHLKISLTLEPFHPSQVLQYSIWDGCFLKQMLQFPFGPDHPWWQWGKKKSEDSSATSSLLYQEKQCQMMYMISTAQEVCKQYRTIFFKLYRMSDGFERFKMADGSVSYTSVQWAKEPSNSFTWLQCY